MKKNLMMYMKMTTIHGKTNLDGEVTKNMVDITTLMILQ